MDDSDAAWTLPIGFGMGFGSERIALDLRLVYRPAFEDEMFRGANQTRFSAGLNSLSGGATVGYSF